MSNLYAKKLSIISLVLASSSLYFYLLRGLMDMNFEKPIPVLIVAVPLILFGSIVFLQIKNNSKHIKISVLVLLFMRVVLTILGIIFIILTNTSFLFIPLLLIFPAYAIYVGVKFLQLNYMKNRNANQN